MTNGQVMPNSLGTFSMPNAAFVSFLNKDNFTGSPEELFNFVLTTFDAVHLTQPDHSHKGHWCHL